MDKDYALLFWGIAIGYWLRPVLSRVWTKINQKCDEWANIS